MEESPLAPPVVVGQRVRLAGKSEWGIGLVKVVARTRVDGQPAHRVTIDFPSGRRHVVVPPGRILPPELPPERGPGWIDQLAGNTLDDRLITVPPELAQHLGTTTTRLTALLPLYGFDEQPDSLLRWARRQTGVGDPLTRWTRDELTLAFAKFCLERDALLRSVAALLVSAQGRDVLHAWLREVEEPAQGRVRAALSRVI